MSDWWSLGDKCSCGQRVSKYDQYCPYCGSYNTQYEDPDEVKIEYCSQCGERLEGSIICWKCFKKGLRKS
ncbi:MAG: hydrogenase maturation nickel metallochaperone HypA [Candidatus Bathyarchaeota archaeon]|nr:hydrogenase maturation nickel metallochaperone HypA [Candidatus Bathyarchaeota archaeon]